MDTKHQNAYSEEDDSLEGRQRRGTRQVPNDDRQTMRGRQQQPIEEAGFDIAREERRRNDRSQERTLDKRSREHERRIRFRGKAGQVAGGADTTSENAKEY
jgi:hypothetical protein